MRKNTESQFHVQYYKSNYLPWLAGPVTLKVKMKELEVTKFLYLWLIQQENDWWLLKRIIIPYKRSLNFEIRKRHTNGGFRNENRRR